MSLTGFEEESPERGLRAALRALAGADAQKHAPARVEALLLQEFRRQHGLDVPSQMSVRRRAWAIAAAAVLVLGAVMLSRSQPVVVTRREIATEFIPLADGLASLPMESGQLMRVRLPRAALVWAGLPVDGERLGESIQADVVFGEDGIARAIRFVNHPAGKTIQRR